MNSIKEIFLSACKLEPERRRAFIEQACAGDPSRVIQIERLLGAHQVEHHRIDDGIFNRLTLDFPKPGEELGPYRLIKEIGEGGFGVVFLAEQIKPFHRQVALKVLKAGMDTRQYLRRFDDERRALALLNHPNIAALYDGGSTDSGRPFFVMELVDGEKITDYCKRHALSLDDKLSLFLSVGSAIEHAHQCGVIHRDLKPSNILVANLHSQSNPTHACSVKIIDFGIAKLIDETRQNEQQTATGDFLGTPMYTSPEQAGGRSVDTRSDIYSLGMVLYELVAGLPPHDPELIKRSSQAQALQYVSQTTPKRPSQRIQEDSLSGSTYVTKQSRYRLRHELDAIVMKAIAQLPQERYASVGQFMADIERYLAHQPISARPQSSGYLLSKFVRRHKLLATALGSALILLGLVAIGGVLFSLRLNQLLQRAHKAEQALEGSNENVTIQAQNAFLNLARSHAGSHSVGQYFESIDALQSALKLSPRISDRLDEYRNIAASALVLPDLRKRKLLDLPQAAWRECAISPTLKLVGYFDAAKQQFCVFDLTAKQVIMRVPDGHWSQSRFDYRGPTFSPDSNYLVYSIVKDGQPRLAIWKVSDQQPVLTLNSSAISVSFRSDMQQCAVTYSNGIVQILKVPDWSLVTELNSPTEEPYAEWNPQNSLLYVWEKKRVAVYDANAFVTVTELANDNSTFGWHAWHPDGQRIASVTQLGELFLWDARTGERLETLQTSSLNRGHLIQFSSSGRYLALNNWQEYLQIVDLQSRERVLQTNARGSTLAFDQHDQVLVADVQLDKLNAFDFHAVTAASKLLDTKGRPFPIANCSVCLDPSGRWLLIPSIEGIAFVDTRNQRVEMELPIPNNRPVGWFASENFFVTVGADGVLRWPVQSLPDSTIRIGPPRQLLAQEAIGMWAADDTGNIIVGGLSTGCGVLIDQQAHTIERIDDGDIRAGTVSPTGTWIATGTHGHPSRTRVWRREGGKLQEQTTLDLGTCLQFSHDEKWCIGIDRGILRWQTGIWNAIAKVSDQLHLGCLSADSRVMAVGLTTNEIDVLEMPSGKSLLRLTSPDSSRQLPLTFSGDGSRLYALGRDNGHLVSFDLKAIESQLAALGFGKPTPWSAPAIDHGTQTEAVASVSQPIQRQPVRFEVELGEYSQWQEAIKPYKQGNRQYAEGNYQPAIELYRQAVKLHPGRSEFENNLAWTLTLYGQSADDKAEAVQHARLATQSAPFVANNWNTLACACWLAGDYKQCLTAIGRSISEKQSAADAYDRMIESVALQGIGEHKAAQDQWRQLCESTETKDLLADDPEFKKLFELARAQLETGGGIPRHDTP